MAKKRLGRKPLPENKKLSNIVSIRVTEEKYRELKHITEYPPYYPMSDLIRCILENRPVTIYTSDPAIEPVREELQAIREKIRLTGTLVNQHTKGFNSHPRKIEKEFYAKLAFKQYASLEPYIDRLLVIVKEQAKRWLNEDYYQNPIIIEDDGNSDTWSL